MTKNTQAALGRALGLSPAAVSKLRAQGMPTHSEEAARAWRRQHLNPARMKRETHRPNVSALLARVHELAHVAGDALALGHFESIEPALRAALRAVPADGRVRILIERKGTGCEGGGARCEPPQGGAVIPGAVMDALVRSVVEVIDADREAALEAGDPDPCGMPLSADEADEMGDFWMLVAAGEVVARTD